MGRQVNAKIVDTDGSDMVPVIGNSDDGGTAILTIATNVAVGADQICRSCIIWTDGADVRVTIDEGGGAADVGDFLLLQNQYLPMPVKNTELLRFYGGTDGKKVYILWRS